MGLRYIVYFFLLWGSAALGAAEHDVEPSLSPTGLDLLYSERPAFSPRGEPLVALGLMHGQTHIRVRANSLLHVDFWEKDVAKQLVVQPGGTVSVRVQKGRAARKSYYVNLEGVPFRDPELLAATVEAWKRRGIQNLQTLEMGSVYGVAGRMLDNREYRIVTPTKTYDEAVRLVGEIHEKHALRPAVGSRLLERPWAALEVRVDNVPVGIATSYVRFDPAPGGLVEVFQVEYGVGYAWHGHEDRRYRGEIYAAVDAAGKLAAVNVVGAETILAGVVPSEIFSSAPAAALRAQAVAARNHLLSRLGRRHPTEPFHLCSEQHCQVYGGVSKEDPRTSAAVVDTAGQAVFLDGNLVDSVYSSTCGGHTEANDAVWGDAPHPALRAKPDFDEDSADMLAFASGIGEHNIDAWVKVIPKSYCARSRHTNTDKLRWRRSFDGQDLKKIVDKHYPKLGRLRHMEITERGPGGRVITLRLHGSRGQATVLHELPIRRLFQNLNSGVFSVQQERDASGWLRKLTFVGAGWGHGVGMCQLGAIGRAEAGHSHEKILAHYYNGAELLPLYSYADADADALLP